MKTFLALLIFFLPTAAFGATLTLTSEPQQIGVGDVVKITLSVTSLHSVNAFAGVLQYPKSFEVVAVSDGNSIVSAWVTRPKVAEAGAVEFAGATAGGFKGESGTLFSLLLRATQAGSASLSLTNIEMYQNDGQGTPEPVTSKPLAISVAQKSLGSYVEPADTTPPEPFETYLTKTDTTYALVFSTLDKGSGVEHYEAAEQRLPWESLAWANVESPYTLHDQYLTSDVAVKAIDRAGNERIEIFHRQNVLRLYEWIIGGIIVVCGYIAFYLLRRFRSRPR